MDVSKIEEILQGHGIKPTSNRIVVLRELTSAERPMSLTELEYKILSIDKSGIFRALSVFKEHHLVHVLEDGGEACATSSAGATATMPTTICTPTSIANGAGRRSAWKTLPCRRWSCRVDMRPFRSTT